MSDEAPPSPVLTPGPLTPQLIARAAVFAARHLGFNPATLFDEARDGRGRARQLAAAALIHPEDRRPVACARVMQVHPNTLAPSQLTTRRLFAADVATVRDQLFPAAPPPSKPVPSAEDKDPKASGWIDPRRKPDREARIVAARLAGQGPAEIAKAENINTTTVHRILVQSGKAFPTLKRGPTPAPDARVRVRTASPKETDPKPRAIAKVQKPVAPAPTPMIALEPFPDNHAAWAPLPGATPVRLIDHSKGCRWPIETGARDAMVCNLGCAGTSPYCERHRWLAASPAVRATLRQPARRCEPADPDIPQSQAA